MSAVVTYDVSDKQDDVKNALRDLGYADCREGTGKDKVKRTYYLPNTTMYHGSKTPQQALDDLKSIVEDLSVDLDRCAAYSAEQPRAAIPGKKWS